MMMTSAQVIETSVNVTTNSPSKDHTDPDDHSSPQTDTICNNLAKTAPFTPLLHQVLQFISSTIFGPQAFWGTVSIS